MPDDIPIRDGDVSPSHDPKTQTQGDHDTRDALEEYFSSTGGTDTEKLENFAKYVPRQNLARFLARYELFKLIQEVHGSIVECGVFYGGGLLTWAKLSAILEPYNFQRRIIGFDTFTGFPEISPIDRSGLPDRKSGHLKNGGLPALGAREDIERAIEIFDSSRFLNHFPKAETISGDFLETGPRFLEEHPHLVVSCLYLDFDIYEPTRLALELFLPRVPKGGIVVFDELNDEAFPGETLAVLHAVGIKDFRIRRFTFEPRISYAVIGE